MTRSEERRYQPCPDCGGSAVVYYSAYLGRDVPYCYVCSRRESAERERQARRVTAALPSLASPLGQRIVRPFVRRYGDEALAHLLGATDAEILKLDGFGPKMLAALRRVVPQPTPGWMVEPPVDAFACEVG